MVFSGAEFVISSVEDEERKKSGGGSSECKHPRECQSRVSSTFITLIALEADK